jgi:ferric-dicitrate binding protein FerR (iron transport regulator)
MNTQIYEEAAEWLVELRVGDVDAVRRERLDSWFRESPHHIRAFLELSSIWEDGGDPDLNRKYSTDALVAMATARSTTATNVIPLERGIPNPAAERIDARAVIRGIQCKVGRAARRASWRSQLVASFAIAACAAGLSFWLYGRLEVSYVTRIGEEKSVRLADGSTLELNSNSRIRVRFSAHERAVDLIEGQALFHVAKDAARPFIVRSDAARVRAVGTQFDVYRKASGTTVTVVEGRVAVSPVQQGASPSAPPTAVGAIILAAGEQVTVAPSKATKPTKADVATATAWTQRELVFDSTPLTEVAQEFNRYNVKQLIVNDADLRDFHVTGVFSSTDSASLLRFLRAQRGISVQESDTDIRISKK